jgi:rhodanese-related sulfurtransferase/rubrerythrin
MQLSDLFRSTPTMSVAEVRTFLDQHQPSQLTLLDVRERQEYEELHLPGAVLIPVGELPRRFHELDPDRPTIVYCRSGGRGTSGTGVLVQAGFRQVWNMAGGMLAWQGLAATGAPEAGMAWFDAAREVADYIRLAAVLEHGARTFYAAMADHFEGEDALLFRDLAAAEEQHLALLTGLGAGADSIAVEEQDVMEGGVSLQEMLGWARQQPAAAVMEAAIAMECNAYDRYLKVAGAARDQHCAGVLEALAAEEKIHLDRLVEVYTREARA